MLDCGAHDGVDSIELANVLGGTVHAIEAVPEVFRKLLQNTANIKSINCYSLALSNTQGNLTMHVSEGNSGASSSILSPKDHLTDHPEIVFNDRIEVPFLEQEMRDLIDLRVFELENNIKT